MFCLNLSAHAISRKWTENCNHLGKARAIILKNKSKLLYPVLSVQSRYTTTPHLKIKRRLLFFFPLSHLKDTELYRAVWSFQNHWPFTLQQCTGTITLGLTACRTKMRTDSQLQGNCAFYRISRKSNLTDLQQTLLNIYLKK